MKRMGDFGWFILLSHDDLPGVEMGVLESDHETVPPEVSGNPVGAILTFVVDDVETIHRHLCGADRIFVDETRAPVLEPGRKATKSGYFWAVAADGEPSCRHAFETDGERPWRCWPTHRVRAFLWTSGSQALTPLRPRPGQGASAELSDRVSGALPAMRRLSVLQRTDRDRPRHWPVAAGLLLDACAPSPQEALRERWLPHRRGDAAPAAPCRL